MVDVCMLTTEVTEITEAQRNIKNMVFLCVLRASVVDLFS